MPEQDWFAQVDAAAKAAPADDWFASIDAPAVSHDAEPEPRNLLEEQIGFAERGETVPVLPGLTQVGGMAIGPIRQLLGKAAEKVAPNLMRSAMGAQQALRKNFRNVDLDRVALREGAVPESARSEAAIAGKAKQAAKDVRSTARKLSVGDDAARITKQELVAGLRPIRREAQRAHSPEAVEAVRARIRQIVREVPSEGLTLREAQSRKQLLQQAGKAARTAPTAKEAGLGAQLADTERKTIAGLQRRSGMGEVLQKSQELMALERAMQNAGTRTSNLGDLLSTAGGATAGAAVGGPMGAMVTAPLVMAGNRMLASPQVRGSLANVLNRTGQTPNPQALEHALRSSILQLLNGTEEPQ